MPMGAGEPISLPGRYQFSMLHGRLTERRSPSSEFRQVMNGKANDLRRRSREEVMVMRWQRVPLLVLLVAVLPVAAAASTSELGIATTAPACPRAEYPAAGAMSIIDGAVEWFACSPDEAYRTVIGVSDDVVLIEESGP